jgi:hypothetical protein
MTTPQKLLQNVARSRARMREAGLRPVQFWVHDTRRPSFADELRGQCLALKNDAHEAETLRITEQFAGDISGWK